MLNPTVWQSLSVCMSPAPSADKRAKRPPGRRGQRGDGWHGAQLIARATPAVQRAEREILNLRLCSAHPHIIHMHEVRSLLARMPASCLGLPNLPRPPGVAKALRQNDASAAAGSLHLAARSAPSPATHACTSGGAGRGVTRAHVTCLFWTHRTITRAAPGACILQTSHSLHCTMSPRRLIGLGYEVARAARAGVLDPGIPGHCNGVRAGRHAGGLHGAAARHGAGRRHAGGHCAVRGAADAAPPWPPLLARDIGCRLTLP